MGQKSRFAGDNVICLGQKYKKKGKSIGEHLNAAFEERYDIDNGVLLEW